MLKLQFKDQRREPFWVIEKLYTIGLASDNHLPLDDPGVDPLHARIVRDGDKYFLKDNNSQSGCYVNGHRIIQKELMVGDLIRIGTVEWLVLDPGESAHTMESEGESPWRLVASGSWLAGQSFTIPTDRPVSLGRAKQCDIVIPGTHLSRRHVELSVQGKSLRIKDLSSANGTFVNDSPITDTLAHAGDILRLDVYSFRIIGPAADPALATRPRDDSQAPAKPVPTPLPASQPKRWKTRPTSPGNREEPTYQENKPDNWLWISLTLIGALLIGALYLL